MKSVLLSTQPKWCELIANGKKTIEVRKTKPKIETPFKVYIYCTKPKDSFKIGTCRYYNDNIYRKTKNNIKGKIEFGDAFKEWASLTDLTQFEILNGKVIGEVLCNYIEDFKKFEYEIDALHRHIKLNACIEYDEIYKYLGYTKNGYGWHISDLKIYDEPKELSCFEKPCPYNEKCFKCKFYDRGSLEDPPCCNWEDFQINRPPQSWCYVEELI